MQIFPNTTIRLLKGVPLDNNYDDTIFFSSVTEQTREFLGYAYLNFTLNTYQRLNKGSLRLQVKADDIYNFNYMMFQNTSYGNKWFYAFITSVEYVNDNTTEINYEIDVMQTWFFDYDLEPCFVERETSEGDAIGLHIESEPIDIGPIKCTNVIDSGHFDSYMGVIAWAERTGT